MHMHRRTVDCRWFAVEIWSLMHLERRIGLLPQHAIQPKFMKTRGEILSLPKKKTAKKDTQKRNGKTSLSVNLVESLLCPFHFKWNESHVKQMFVCVCVSIDESMWSISSCAIEIKSVIFIILQIYISCCRSVDSLRQLNMNKRQQTLATIASVFVGVCVFVRVDVSYGCQCDFDVVTPCAFPLPSMTPNHQMCDAGSWTIMWVAPYIWISNRSPRRHNAHIRSTWETIAGWHTTHVIWISDEMRRGFMSGAWTYREVKPND